MVLISLLSFDALPLRNCDQCFNDFSKRRKLRPTRVDGWAKDGSGGYEGSINIKRSWCPTRNAQKLRLFGKFGLLKVSSR